MYFFVLLRFFKFFIKIKSGKLPSKSFEIVEITTGGFFPPIQSIENVSLFEKEKALLLIFLSLTFSGIVLILLIIFSAAGISNSGS